MRGVFIDPPPEVWEAFAPVRNVNTGAGPIDCEDGECLALP